MSATSALAALLVALVEAMLVAALVGMVEGARVVTAGADFDLAAWAVASALAGATAVVAASLLLGVLAVLSRLGPLAAWLRALAAGGPLAALALWRAVLVAAFALAFALSTLAISSGVHVRMRFLAGDTVGLVVAALVTPVALVLAALAFALDRRVSARLARGASSVPRIVPLALATIVLAALPPLLVRLAAPAATLDPYLFVSLLAAAVLAARGARLGRRRAPRLIAAACAAACAAGLARLPAAERARADVVSYGVFSSFAAQALWYVADRDGDGYAPVWAGGADCDDADPRRFPTAPDVAGNALDENCTGRDATAADLASRVAPRPPSSSTRANLVLITIDTLRADRLGAYGYPRPTSPAIDAFAAAATRFAWALTTCPATRCSIPALHTGRLPSLADHAAPTLASTLRAAGYDTAAITCCERFAAGTPDAAGFAWVDVSADAARVRRPGQSNADVVADAALRWLALSRRPFFLWLHFYDPHHPYSAPESPMRFGTSPSDRYDAEIAYTDRHVGRVLAALPADTVVALTSDHGEEFGERVTRFHARSLRNAAIRIPLVIQVPGAPPRVLTRPVSLVDIMPTLLDLAGVSGPAGMHGRSLASSILAGTEPSSRPVLVELVPDNVLRRDIAAVVVWPYKLVWARDAAAFSLYSLADDPDEARDLSSSDPSTLRALQGQLRETLDRELSIP